MTIDPPPCRVVPPGVEVALHRRTRRKILRQQAPWTAAAQQIHDRVHHLAQVRGSRPPHSFGRRHEGLDQFPFPIGQVACVALPVAFILRASDFRPHVVSPVIASTTIESQPTEITQLFSGRTLNSATAVTTTRGSRKARHPRAGRTSRPSVPRRIRTRVGPRSTARAITATRTTSTWTAGTSWCGVTK